MPTHKPQGDAFSCLSPADLERVTGGYVSHYDDFDWCGTPVPGRPPLPYPGLKMSLGDAVSLNPQPLPPKALGLLR